MTTEWVINASLTHLGFLQRPLRLQDHLQGLQHHQQSLLHLQQGGGFNIHHVGTRTLSTGYKVLQGTNPLCKGYGANPLYALQVGLGGINDISLGYCKSMLASMTILSTPSPLSQESLSIVKGLEKSGIARTNVVHISCFSFSN